MNEEYFKQRRKSNMDKGEIYFFTATINKWQKLLTEEKYKQIVLSSLEYLSEQNKIDVFAFVIMPNHIHIIWRIKQMNGKESASTSFLKYTAHKFKELLSRDGENGLNEYWVDAANKQFEFWQRDSLAVRLYSKGVMLQKLNYIHNNPLAKHWQLATESSDYKYSTAKYYELGIKDYGFIKDIRDEM